MTWKQRIVRVLRKYGYDLSRYRAGTHPEVRRNLLMRTYGIDLVLDIGANCGDYGRELREGGYGGSIVSFEPLAAVFRELEAEAAKDPGWTAKCCALGAERSRQTIHVAGNSASSSLLEMLPAHLEAAPYAGYVGEETVQVETLDELFDGIAGRSRSVWMKIDTQGYERQVLDGARQSLARIDTVQMELSLTALYEGSAGYLDLVHFMTERQYEVVAIDPGFSDPKSGRLLQADFTFHRAAGR